MPTQTATPIADSADIADIELFADSLDVQRAAAIYQEHGCLVVRGLLSAYVPELAADIDFAARQAIGLLDRARQVPEGWVTPDGTLFLPAPAHFGRDRQIMVLACS
ncbi:MAG: mitomycin antibiotic biosynthesis protein, partial [Gemmatimonadota bacterium]